MQETKIAPEDILGGDLRLRNQSLLCIKAYGAEMKHKWILETLSELRVFSAQNGLPALAKELEAVTLLATLELTNLPQHEGHSAPETMQDRV